MSFVLTNEISFKDAVNENYYAGKIVKLHKYGFNFTQRVTQCSELTHVIHRLFKRFFEFLSWFESDHYRENKGIAFTLGGDHLPHGKKTYSQ